MSELILNGFLLLLLIGAGLCIWLMQLIVLRNFIVIEPAWLMHARRSGLTILALGLLWAAKYCVQHSWDPWPPYLLIVLAVDFYLSVAIISGYYHSSNYENRNKLSNIPHH